MGVSDAQGRRIYGCHIGTKADMVALTKIGCLTRTFAHGPKAATSRALCRGICHLCDAGREGPNPVPFEELATASPQWKATMFQTKPWITEPPILLGALTEPGKETFSGMTCGTVSTWARPRHG